MVGPRVTGVAPRYATAAEWAASPLTLRVGEEGVAWDTGVRKLGDGTHRWAELPTIGGPGSSVDQTARDMATNARQMVLTRDPRLAAVEATAANADTVHADLYARLAQVSPTTPPAEDGTDLVLMFENGLV